MKKSEVNPNPIIQNILTDWENNLGEIEMLGTLINTGTVITGCFIGLFFHKKLPKKIITIVFQGIGLFTLFLGFSMALKTEHLLLMIFSLVLGAIIGELIDIDKKLHNISELLKTKFKSKNDHFAEGLITAFLLFCMGSMTVLGAFEEGLGGKPNLLLAKSILDGFSSIALSSALGIGVLFSVIPLIIYQGGLTILAGLLENYFTTQLINELSAVGGILLIGLGISILKIKEIKIVNMLPSLLVVVVLSLLFI